MTDWQDISTIPEDVFVDVWVVAKNFPDWGKRITDVCKTSKHSYGWTGIERGYITDDVYPAFWMPLPEPPKAR